MKDNTSFGWAWRDAAVVVAIIVVCGGMAWLFIITSWERSHQHEITASHKETLKLIKEEASNLRKEWKEYRKLVADGHRVDEGSTKLLMETLKTIVKQQELLKETQEQTRAVVTLMNARHPPKKKEKEKPKPDLPSKKQ